MSKQQSYFKQLTQVKDYQLREIIGKGSFGQVYKAIKDSKVYAIKVLDKQLIKQKNIQKYVDNEIQAMKNLNH